MAMAFFSDLKTLLHPYYIVNLLLSLSYLIAKSIGPVCELLFEGECDLGGRQSEILFFLALIVMIRSRRAGTVGLVAYLTNSFVYAKIANAVLWFLAYKPYGFIFLLFFLLQGLVLPQPVYSGPENIIYFRDDTLFKEEIEKKGKLWIVEFYTTWNPACITFAPVFSQLSVRYGLNNIKFGKVDVGRFPQIGERFRISDSAFSKQLPTVILFKDGEPVTYRPTIDTTGRVIKFQFTMENMITSFGLNDLYNEYKNKGKETVKSSSKRPKTD